MIVQQNIFEPMVSYITSMNPFNQYVEIKLPEEFNVNYPAVMKYFCEDVVYSWERGKGRKISGTIKDKEVFYFLYVLFMAPRKVRFKFTVS